MTLAKADDKKYCHKICNDLEELDKLHELTGWTPSSRHIRPSPEIISKKNVFLSNLKAIYNDVSDYILHKLFGYKIHRDLNYPFKLIITDNIQERRNVLVENIFPYQTTDETKHLIMWYIIPIGGTIPTDDEISCDIEKELKKFFLSEFVWYENPKMSVVSNKLYHVQVFAK
jgi:hypothetical protein